MEESPIFAKTYDLLRWLLPQTTKFPRSQRFVLARQIEEAAFGFHLAILRARVDGNAGTTFVEADTHLAALRLYLRLAADLGYLSLKQYEHAARAVDEVGRLLGGWQRVRSGLTKAVKADEASIVGAGPRPARRVLEQQPEERPDGEPEQ